MGDGRHVGDAADLVATSVQGTHSGLTTRAGALDVYVEVLQTIFQSGLTSALGCNLGSKRRALARTAETRSTGGGPAQSVALTIGNGDDGVIERRVDVSNPIDDRLFYFLTKCRVM